MMTGHKARNPLGMSDWVRDGMGTRMQAHVWAGGSDKGLIAHVRALPQALSSHIFMSCLDLLYSLHASLIVFIPY